MHRFYFSLSLNLPNLVLLCSTFTERKQPSGPIHRFFADHPPVPPPGSDERSRRLHERFSRPRRRDPPRRVPLPAAVRERAPRPLRTPRRHVRGTQVRHEAVGGQRASVPIHALIPSGKRTAFPVFILL